MKLNLVMIVKNEARSIKKCLEAAKPLVDRMIVVDTGSEDETAKIARNMGAEAFFFSWVDDFSAARNYALEQSDGDWNLVLDADEYLRPCSRRTLERILTSRGGTWLGGLTRYDSFEEEDGGVSQVNRYYVFTVVRSQAEQQEVEVLHTADTYYLVRPVDQTSAGRLRAGDEIILNSSGVYDGKVVR